MPSKSLILYKARSKNKIYFLGALAMSTLLAYSYIMDLIFVKNKEELYIFLGALCLATVIFFGYEVFDKRPLYKFNNEGIFLRRGNKILAWTSYSSYLFIESYTHVFTAKLELYAANGELTNSIDLSNINRSIREVEEIVQQKLTIKISK